MKTENMLSSNWNSAQIPFASVPCRIMGSMCRTEQTQSPPLPPSPPPTPSTLLFLHSWSESWHELPCADLSESAKRENENTVKGLLLHLPISVLRAEVNIWFDINRWIRGEGSTVCLLFPCVYIWLERKNIKTGMSCSADGYWNNNAECVQFFPSEVQTA